MAQLHSDSRKAGIVRSTSGTDHVSRRPRGIRLGHNQKWFGEPDLQLKL